MRSGRFRPAFRPFYWAFIADVVLLGYIGSQPAQQPYIIAGQLAALYYFGYFLVVLPLLSVLERPLPLPESIGTAVLAHKGAHA